MKGSQAERTAKNNKRTTKCPRCDSRRADVMDRQVGTTYRHLCAECADEVRATGGQLRASDPPERLHRPGLETVAEGYAVLWSERDGDVFQTRVPVRVTVADLVRYGEENGVEHAARAKLSEAIAESRIYYNVGEVRLS